MKLDRKGKKLARANLRQRDVHVTWIIRGKSSGLIHETYGLSHEIIIILSKKRKKGTNLVFL